MEHKKIAMMVKDSFDKTKKKNSTIIIEKDKVVDHIGFSICEYEGTN